MEKQYVVLYTHQKQKKAKTWHDGCLKHTGNGTKAVLYDEKGCRLDSIHIKVDDIRLGEQLESDRYYILIEEMKADNTQNSIATINADQTGVNKGPTSSQVTFSRARCAGLKRKTSGFMPPRMNKQSCIENSQGSILEDARCTNFLESNPHRYSGNESRVRVPLLPQQANVSKDSGMQIERNTSKSTGLNEKSENIERNLFNLYSRYNKQESGSETANSSQESSTFGESKRLLSPWSVYGSKDSSPSLNVSTFRQKPVSNKAWAESNGLVSDTEERNKKRFVNENENLTKCDNKDIYNIDKLDSSQLDIRQSDASLQHFSKVSKAEEKGFYCSENLYTSRTSIKVFERQFDQCDKVAKQQEERNKRNLTQIMNLLKRKPTHIGQNDMKDIPSNTENVYQQLQQTVSKSKTGDINISATEGSESSKMTERQDLEYDTEIFQENIFCKDPQESETHADKKGRMIGHLNGERNCDIEVVKVSSAEEGTANRSAAEKSKLPDESAECFDDVIGSFDINFSPLSHVTDSEHEEDDNDGDGNSENSNQYDSGCLHHTKVSDGTLKFPPANEIINQTNFQRKETNSPKNKTNLSTDEASTFIAFQTENADSHSLGMNVQMKDANLQICSDNIPGDFPLAIGETSRGNFERNAEVHHVIDVKFAINDITERKDYIESCDCNDGSFENSTEVSTGCVLNRNNEINIVMETTCQKENSDTNVDGNKDNVMINFSNNESEMRELTDNESKIKAECDASELIDETFKERFGYESEMMEENTESQCSRVTSLSQDTLDFSCNTYDSQNDFGIPTGQLNMLQSRVRTSEVQNVNIFDSQNRLYKVKERNSESENDECEYFENNTHKRSSQNEVNSKILFRSSATDKPGLGIVNTEFGPSANIQVEEGQSFSNEVFCQRAAGIMNNFEAPINFQDVQEWESEDPVGKRTATQMQKTGRAQGKVKSGLGNYGTQGLSSAVVARVYHTGTDDSGDTGTSWTCRNTTDSPLMGSYQAHDLDKWSPFQQLSSSELSAQSSPSFYIDWHNDKPVMQKAHKVCEGEAVPVFRSQHGDHSPTPECKITRPASQHTDNEEIYEQLYKPRLMYQKDNDQNNFDYTEYQRSEINGSQTESSLKSQDTAYERLFNNENYEKANCDNLKGPANSIESPDFQYSEKLFKNASLQHRQSSLKNQPFCDSQLSEDYFLRDESKSLALCLESAEEKTISCLSDDSGNEKPNLLGKEKIQNSRWQSFVASQASDDCNIDVNELSKKVEIVHRPKKQFVTLKNSPGLYNTQRVVYQKSRDSKPQPALLSQSLTDELESKSELFYRESSCTNTSTNLNSEKQSSTSEIPTGSIDPSLVEYHGDNQIEENAAANENPESYLDTMSSDDSLEQLLADEDFDIEIIKQKETNTEDVNCEQQVPNLETVNVVECKTIEHEVSSVPIESQDTPEACIGVSKDLSNDCSSDLMMDNVSVENAFDIASYSVNGNEGVIPSDSKNALDKISDESIEKMVKSDAKSTGENTDQLTLDSGVTENVSAKERNEKNLQDVGGNKTVDHSDKVFLQKVDVKQNEKNHSHFSLDESLDLSFDSSNVSLEESDQLDKRARSMRIGWRPPVKTVSQVIHEVPSSNTVIPSQVTNVASSEKMKPTFKCLRLLAERKENVNLMNNGKTFEGITNSKTKEIMASFPVSENSLKNQQRYQFKSPLQSPTLSITAKCPGDDDLMLNAGKETVTEYSSAECQQQRSRDDRLPGSTSNKRFKPPSMTRSSATERPAHLSSPRMTPGFKSAEKQGSCVSQTELRFPSKFETEGIANILRHVVIPETFLSAALYKQILTAAVTEHVNTQLFDVSKRFHHALSKVDTSAYSEYKSGNSRSKVSNPNPACQCGVPSKMICVKKEGPNCGRYFYACSADRKQQCKFFQWADEARRGSVASGSRRKINDVNTLNMYMKDQRTHFYGECQLMKRTKENINKYFKAPKWARGRAESNTAQKKQILLKLPYKGRSSLYAKDDIWVISKHLDFDPLQTFLARSTFYGPSSSLEVEIEPISGYSPSNWRNEELCHALLAGNVSSELSYVDNIREHIQAQSPPVLPYLLNRQTEDTGRFSNSNKGFQAPRSAGNLSRRNIHIHSEQMDDLSRQYIKKYNLNADQAEALRRAANMFSIEKSSTVDSILLIHGVFGAGKSYLLSVMVLFLVEVFQLNDSQSPDKPFPWKLLISSTTNVAVDRILNGLLELGFDEFIRVGSVKKIAKSVLPFSVHASGTDNQELKDLQEMLRSGELTATEKSQVRQSIEKHRLGENKKKLGRVRVVGATCASCSLTCLNNMEFPLVLLDECSQMTEPASLLPIAKFGCQKLILVGDPKQLDPTIQGAEAAHQNGLEQTMFDRLIKMGCMPTLLRTQYRCHPHISTVANKLFYGGMLEDGVSKCDRSPLLEILPTICYYDVERGEECCEGAGSYYNEKEAQFVVFLLQVLIFSGIEPSSMGVITLYKSQMARITDLLTGKGDSVDMKGVQVSTVDAFQGGERDVIILSTVRSQACGFIDNDKRTNVALTRARRHLLIVGNLNNLSKNVLWSKVINHCKCYSNGVQSADEARHSLEKYLENMKKNETSQASENSKPFTSQNSSVSEKQARKRKPKRKRKLSNTEMNNVEHQRKGQSLNQHSDFRVTAPKRTRKGAGQHDQKDNVTNDEDFEINVIDDMIGTNEDSKSFSEESSINSKPFSPATQDDQLSGDAIDDLSDTYRRKRPKHVTKLNSLVFDSDTENTEEGEDLPVFNCD